MGLEIIPHVRKTARVWNWFKTIDVLAFLLEKKSITFEKFPLVAFHQTKS